MTAKDILYEFDNDEFFQRRNGGNGCTDLDTWLPNFIYAKVAKAYDLTDAFDGPDWKEKVEKLQHMAGKFEGEVFKLMWDRNDNAKSDRHIVYGCLGEYLFYKGYDEDQFYDKYGYNYNDFTERTGLTDLSLDEIIRMFPKAAA